MYKTAFSMAKMEEYDHILDLYCGIGTISLCSGVTKPISGVEIVPEAVRDAEENALLNGIRNASFSCGDAADAFRILKDSGAVKPLLILDPPRKGLPDNLISDIASHGVSDVLYISCNPETFARDLAHFSKMDYRIGAVQPVDLFPRTSHVECVVLMSRDRE